MWVCVYECVSGMYVCDINMNDNIYMISIIRSNNVNYDHGYKRIILRYAIYSNRLNKVEENKNRRG